MNIDLFKKYNAKPNEDLFTHIFKMLKLLEKLAEINNLNTNQVESLKRIIIYHDIGKIVEVNQNAILNKSNRKAKIRHEILSCMLEGLKDYERLIILTHHRSNRKIEELLNEVEDFSDEINLENYLKEIEYKIGMKGDIEIEDLFDLIEDDSLLENKEYILLKGIFMLCDHLASGGVDDIKDVPIFKDLYKFGNYTSIQEKARINKELNLLIKAPTGFGKTETSFFFADTVQNIYKNRRIFYILPYTASINAMYNRLKDLDVDVGMLHGKAQYFLYKELEDIHKVKNEYSVFQKLIKPVTVCTMFQIVKFIFNCKFNEMILSMLSNSIFIIDEVHCFDLDNLIMLTETLKYLQDNFNISICIMSASIPKKYSKYIMERLHINNILTPTLEEYQQVKRHKINTYKNLTIMDKLENIKQDILDDKKVLICSNLVDTSQEIYSQLNEFCKIHNKKIRLLHSRFITRDREKIENEVVNKKDCDVLIGTQAIEVSLDIDYDTLYTEIAPIDALLQRFGRVNRKRIEKLKNIKNIHILKELRVNYIYNKVLINNTWEVLSNIDIVKEELVQNYIDQVYVKDFNRNELETTKFLYEKKLAAIKMGEWNKSVKDEMISNTGVKVIPIAVHNEYKNYIDEKNYMSANAMFLSISEGLYARLENKGLIEKEDGIKIVNCFYNDEVGLITNNL